MVRKPISKRKAQKNKADRIAGQKCRDRGYCQLAGLDTVRCGGGLQWAHIVGRSNHRLRWEGYNCLCLCAGHHVWFTHHPFEWFEIIQNKFPGQYAMIQAHRNELFDGDYDKVLAKLEF